MNHLARCSGLAIFGLGAWLWACTESDGALILPEIGDAADEASAPSPADAAEASAPEASDAEEPLPTCSVGGFCRTELPNSEILFSIWGAADGSLWAGGSRTLLRWDGALWLPVFTWPEGGAPGVRVRVIAGTGPEDVWAIGDGPEYDAAQFPHPAILHWARRDSQLAWRALTTDIKVLFGSVMTAYVASPTDLWLAGGYQGVWHAHGEDATGHVAAERELDSSGVPLLGDPTGLWGFGADRVFVSGYNAGEAPVLMRRTLDGSWIDAVGAPSYSSTWRLFGTPGIVDARLWMYDGFRTNARPVDAAGALLAPTVARDTTDTPLCTPLLASVVRPDLAWTSDGATVCVYENDSFKIAPITLGAYPRFKVNAIWSNGTDTWVVGEEKPVARGALGRGFALHRKGGS